MAAEVTCFTELVDEVTLHFQTIRLPKQLLPFPINRKLNPMIPSCIINTFSYTFAPMASINDQDEVIRSESDAPPSHYIVKIESFSQLAKHGIEKYETGSFEAGGYKWKLVLYPNGNKSKSVKEHVSLYLAMADTSSLRPCWEVYAVFRLYLLDQNKDNYLILQGNEKRFHSLKQEWGFDKFIPFKSFNDVSNGYLLDDTCVFGADVYVSKERSSGRGECLSMVKDAVSSKHVWRIDNFSKLDAECCDSKVFFSGDQKWKIKLYPKGRHQGTGTHVSLYLALADTETIPPGTKIFAEFTIRILDQLQARHISGKSTNWFSSSKPDSGWPKYVTFYYLNLTNGGLLVRDTCLVEAEVTVHGIANAL